MSWFIHPVTCRLTLNRLQKVWWSNVKTIKTNILYHWHVWVWINLKVWRSDLKNLAKAKHVSFLIFGIQQLAKCNSPQRRNGKMYIFFNFAPKMKMVLHHALCIVIVGWKWKKLARLFNNLKNIFNWKTTNLFVVYKVGAIKLLRRYFSNKLQSFAIMINFFGRILDTGRPDNEIAKSVFWYPDSLLVRISRIMSN